MLKKIFAMLFVASQAFSLTVNQHLMGDANNGSCAKINCKPYVSETPCCNDAFKHFYIAADLLYWTTHISNLELDFGTASISQKIKDCVLITHTKEFDKEPHFNWQTGFRIAAGYQLPCDWEIAAIWTHFLPDGCSHSKRSCDIANGGKCKLQYNQLDVVTLYNITQCPLLSPLFKLQPFFGIRATKIHEDIHSHLITEIIDPTFKAVETRKIVDIQNFRGLGPVLGMNGDLDIGCGFGTYGTVACSLLYGDYKAHSRDSNTFTAPISNQIFSFNKRRLHRFIWNIDLGVGVRWQTCLYNSVNLLIKLGFEHHQYFNQNRLGSNNGDLIFDGGVFSICFTY